MSYLGDDALPGTETARQKAAEGAGAGSAASIIDTLTHPSSGSGSNLWLLALAGLGVVVFALRGRRKG